MRYPLHAPAVIALTLSLFAQQTTQSPDETEEHPSSSCMVSGRVITADEGSPLKSARVALMPNSGSRRQIYAASSDSDGRFVIKDVAPGGYGFLATRAGFVDQHYKEKRNDGGAILSLKPGDKISDVLFRLTRTSVVTGRVTNEDGEAMSRVQVVALRGPSEEEIEDEGRSASRKLHAISSAQTDDRGQYRIFGLKPGEYYIKATDSFEPDHNLLVDQSYWLQQELGSEYAAMYSPGVPQASQAQVVSVRAGEEVQADVSMQRIKAVEVAGHVIGRDGPPRIHGCDSSNPEGMTMAWTPGHDRREGQLQTQGRTAG